jgi:hypothetical protein
MGGDSAARLRDPASQIEGPQSKGWQARCEVRLIGYDLPAWFEILQSCSRLGVK